MSKTTTIKDCNFTGIKEVKWDADATEAILIVAKALLNLTELFKAHNVVIEALLNVTPGGVKRNC
jgi:hypothetical protein